MWHIGEEPAWQCRRCKRCGFHPWFGKIPWRREWLPSAVFLPGEFHGQSSLVGYSSWGCQESDTTEWLHFHFSLSCIGEGNGSPLQYSCLQNPMDRGVWWAVVHGVAKSWTWLSDFTFTFHFHALEKEMAAHSSVLAWRIPGTGAPGGLLSMRSHRVGHNWSGLAAAAADRKHFTQWQKKKTTNAFHNLEILCVIQDSSLCLQKDSRRSSNHYHLRGLQCLSAFFKNNFYSFFFASSRVMWYLITQPGIEPASLAVEALDCCTARKSL